MADARVYQAHAEVAVTGAPSARVYASFAEVMLALPAEARTAQAFAEVLVSLTSAPTGRRRRPQVMLIED